MSFRILVGDCRDTLQSLADQSVQCCVTSPPYYGLRDYGHALQLGLEKTPAEYVEKMVQVFRDVRRVLRDDGTLWLNIGDSYAGGGTIGRNDTSPEALARRSEKYGTGRGAGSLVGTQGTRQRVTEMKPKDLIGIPWMLAFALRADGWYLRSDIIWHKPNPMPESVTDRPTKSHEYLFLLSKSERYFFDADAVREAHKPESENRYRYSLNSAHSGFAKDARTGSSFDKMRDGAAMGDFVNIAGRNIRSVWTIATQPYVGAHFATFPPKLIEPCILAGSARQACEHCGKAWERIVERGDDPLYVPLAERKPHGATQPGNATIKSGTFGSGRPTTQLGFAPSCDCGSTNPVPSTVLDPFGGAGTTGLVADRLGRDSILCELNEKYAEMARKRITDDSPLFAERLGA